MELGAFGYHDLLVASKKKHRLRVERGVTDTFFIF